MKIFIKTYGCQMNERDSEALGAMLSQQGHQLTASEAEADVMLFNTCSVRDAAERKAKGKIGFMRKYKKAKPQLIIGVLGCMAQRLGDELLAELPNLDFVLGTGQIHRVPEVINKIAQERKKIADTEFFPDEIEMLGAHGESSWSGQIAITRGCNRFCSYCIVPYVRGREVSRSKESILTEAREMVASGVREILLLGQNVAAYGLNGDIRPPADDHSPFAELLEELNEIPGLLRIRYTSPYVSYFNRRLIDALASCSKVCHNIHLPLQSGSDTILKAMNRQYTAASYLEKVAQLRDAMPDLTFSTDVIVGFPGETEEDFRKTRDLMNQVGFEQAFVFKYSPRPGAKSAEIADTVSEEIKLERNNILLDDLKLRIGAKLKQQTGSVVEVLTEGVSARNASRWTGRTATSFVVHFEPDEACRPGTLRRVEITRAGEVSLFGRLLPEDK
ncbi:MAG: tRNA (N6-isopentenyl adenosine(37)-C2)-methylthiotransferase MiaB [Lentisphaerae bacterium]|nr:tRNA (N6-isopentenyl adenosine(37)-C2)-methylthiotransferase MiaB [Lentisphaerota bacterium]